MIDSTISQSALNDTDRAIIAKYNFEVRDNNGRFLVIDPVYRKANGGKGGRYEGGSITSLLTAACAQRQSLDDSSKAPSDQLDKRASRKKANPVKQAAAKAVASNDAGTGKTNKPETPASTSPKTAGNASDMPKGKAPKTKEKPAKVAKDNRYLRASRIIINKRDIAAPALAKAANMSVSTAGHCLEAWKGVTAALAEKGLLK